MAGYNYLEQYYARDHATYPERVILGSENSHSLEAWRAVAANDYVAGQFLWTGIDYLGESQRYPSRGSTAGLLDYCGFRKPLAYLREALWSDRPMVYAAAQTAGPGRASAGRTLELERGRAQDHSSGGVHKLRFRGVDSQRPLAGRKTGGGPA